MRYKAVVFDLDGTLLNTLSDLCDSVNHVMRSFSFPEQTLEQTKSKIGDGIKMLIERSVPGGSENPFFEEAFLKFKDYYTAHSNIKTAPFDGILELIDELKSRKIHLAVVSNKNDAAVKLLCKEYFGDVFEAVIGETPQGRRTPAPDSVFAAIDLMGLDKSDCVYVGDSQVDVATAKNAGIDLIAVTWGFRDKEILKKAGAAVFAESPQDILDFIEKE
jgi:phosphoglycolate phosphatase